MKQVRIIDFLRDCPLYTRLYSPLYGYCEFLECSRNFIFVRVSKSDPKSKRYSYITYKFNESGKPCGRIGEENEIDTSECMLFPSHTYKSWKNWQAHLFKDGDIIVENTADVENRNMFKYKRFDVCYGYNGIPFIVPPSELKNYRYATKEEQIQFKELQEKFEKDNNGARKQLDLKETIEITKLTNEKRENLLKDLETLMNKYGIDTICNVPDFILADTLLDTIYSVEKLQGRTNEWFGRDSEIGRNMSTDIKFLQRAVVKLWDILDNIDNYAELNINDTDENNPFRNICRKTSERFKYVRSDGYNLFIGDECIDDGKGICIDKRYGIRGELKKHLKEDIDDIYFDLDGVAVKGSTYYLTVEDIKEIAKRFFELGVKTQKKIYGRK